MWRLSLRLAYYKVNSATANAVIDLFNIANSVYVAGLKFKRLTVRAE